MTTDLTRERWPSLAFEAVRPTAAYVHRIAQIAGKYTLGQPFEPNWGNVLMDITPGGFVTPTMDAGGVSFRVEYDLVGGSVGLDADTGRVSLPLRSEPVADFLARFAEAATPLGIPPLANLSQPEIAGAPPLDEDTEPRTFDPGIARRMAAALGSVHHALVLYQAPFHGPRPRVGLWWGGFDVSAGRFNGRRVTPPDSHPVFLQNGMTNETVAVGFTFGDERSPVPAFYAYIAPQPEGIEGADLGPGASWVPEAGIAVLPWDTVRAAADPTAAVVGFADAVYAVAEATGRWPAELVGKRLTGGEAVTRPVFEPAP